MGLVIKRRNKEECFLFVAGELNLGDYVKMRIYKIGEDGGGYFARDGIDAPESITILRDKQIELMGGLESVIEQIKYGTFEFKTSKYETEKKWLITKNVN